MGSHYLDTWFKENYTQFFNFIYRMTKDYHLSSDILHDCYERAAIKFSFFDCSKGTVKNWIYRMAINLYKDRLRYMKREKDYMSKLPKDEAYVHSHKPDAADILDMCLNCMAPEKKALIILSFDHSYTEIGEILDIPEGTVKSRIFYIKNELKEIIEKYGVEVYDEKI